MKQPVINLITTLHLYMETSVFCWVLVWINFMGIHWSVSTTFEKNLPKTWEPRVLDARADLEEKTSIAGRLAALAAMTLRM